jgi:glycine/D-amino acid oxidase-like deaminating enzyme
MTTAIIAGGGIAGLLAAKLLSRQHDRVVLVERDKACGGLIGSVTDEAGVVFDHGAHVLSETGVPAIDELLFGDLNESDWHTFHVLRADNWFAGAMNRESPFPDARRLGAEVLRRGLAELAQAATTRYDAPPKHLGEALERRFGTTLATQVAGPVVRKQLGIGPEHLHPNTPFGIRRIVCGDAAESRQLKQDPRYAEPVAFASYEEGVGALRHRYPRAGGIGRWVDGFVAGLRIDGVEFALGRVIATVTHANGCISSVTLDNGDTIACDRLAWTLPSALLLSAAGVRFESPPPLLAPTGLFHLVFDTAFDDPNYHITCYDDTFRTFRVTLYPNVQARPQQGPYNCTVEVIGEPNTDFAPLLSRIVEELRLMGITPPSARLISSQLRVVPVGFPATTHDFIARNATQAALVHQHLDNAILIGRARCPPFFTTDVLIEVHRSLSSHDEH